MEYDVRFDSNEDVTIIKFSDGESRKTHHIGAPIAERLNKGVFVYIEDSTEGSVRIEDEAHARFLIKALEKAMQLGWF